MTVVFFFLSSNAQNSELISTNSDFGSGSSTNWTKSGDVNFVGTGYTYCNSCPGYAVLGVDGSGYKKNNASGTLKRTISIPSNVVNGSTATLTFYIYISTDETNNTVAYDKMSLTLYNSSSQGYYKTTPYSNVDYSSGYIQSTLTFSNISSYAGQNMTLTLEVTNDNAKPTAFRVDDFSFTVQTATAKPDLIIEQFPTLSSSSVQSGNSSTVYFKVINQGSGSAPTSNTSFHISKNNYYDGSANWIADYSTASIASGNNSGSLSKTITIPSGTSPGNYYILVSADGAGSIDESNESNQTTYVAITVSSPPQYGNLSVSISPQGAIDNGAQWRVDGGSWYNSGATVYNLTTGNHSVDYKSISGYTVPSNASVSISANSTTNTSGTYVINSSGKPDLTLNNFIPESSTLGLGSTVKGTIEFKNIGNSNASNVNATFWISNDCSGIISNDYMLATSNNYTISQSSTITVNFTLSLPNDNKWLGTKYIKCWINYSGSIDESNSNNNILCSQITIQQNAQQFGFDNDGIFHLRWPFYNQYVNGMNGIYNGNSQWNNQKLDEVRSTEWYYTTHKGHTGRDLYAQDWNFPPPGDGDCGLHFYSPMKGKIIAIRNTCGEACTDAQSDDACGGGYGNSVMIQSLSNPDVVFLVAHMTRINTNLYLDQIISVGDYIGDMGMTGSGDGPHFHCMVNKGLSASDLNGIRSSQTYGITSDVNACKFAFDAVEGGGADAVINLSFDDMKVYPNPSNGNFNISFNSNFSKELKVSITNMAGIKVHEVIFNSAIGLNNFEITSDLPNGIYLLAIKDNSMELFQSYKIVIIK